jgi:enoyl-CoA hydratase/carnithine racemase
MDEGDPYFRQEQTSSTPESNISPIFAKASAKTKAIIQELGLRYLPSGQAADQHRAKIALLAQDCADVPPHLLERAAQLWARERQFLPKAPELIALAQSLLNNVPRKAEAGSDHALAQLQAHCDLLNESEERMRSNRRWFVNGQAPKRYVDVREIDAA